MSDIKQRIKSKIAERAVTKVTVLGDIEVLCRRQSIGVIESIKENQDEKSIMAFLANQFLSIEEREPVFTAKMLVEEIPNGDVQDLLKIFFKVNGGESDNLDKLEKN